MQLKKRYSTRCFDARGLATALNFLTHPEGI